MRMLALLCLASLAMAGCLEPGPEEPADGDTVTNATVVTDPADPSALANASAPGWHLHDYWGGEDLKVAVHDEHNIGGWTCNGCAAIPLRFRGDPGMLVPLGTAEVEVRVEWHADGDTTHGTPELWVKPANASEPAFATTLTNGDEFRLNTTNEQADPPHQALSRWEFWVLLPSVDGQAEFAGTVRMHAEAVRGLPIPLFPPHPDLWGGATELQLFDVTNPLVMQSASATNEWCNVACLGTHRPDDGVIVPYDASEILVTLTYEPGMPAGLGLRAHGGDTWDMQTVDGEPTPPNAVTFRVPVTGKTGDSPYAKQSLWEFEVYMDQPTPERAFIGGYRLTAVVIKG